jgi:hypothetical protein
LTLLSSSTTTSFTCPKTCEIFPVNIFLLFPLLNNKGVSRVIVKAEFNWFY